jgi:FtsP/CotA-like multicopper oxidase with cupredoxin domain
MTTNTPTANSPTAGFPPLLPDRRRVLAGLGLSAGAMVAGTRVAPAQPAPLLLTARRLTAAGGATSMAYDPPGLVLRARRGEPLGIRLANQLGEATSLHWHGVRTQAATPPPLLPQAVPAGASTPVAMTPRDAGTFLYRPGPTGEGPRQMAEGLAGILIVDGPSPPAADRELVLHLSETSPGTESPRLLVNGAAEMVLSGRTNERLWLRLANATPHRLLQLTIPDDTVTLVALDGQPCEPFRLDGGRIVLGPGQRAEALWDVTGAPRTTRTLILAALGGAMLSGTLTLTDEAPVRAEPMPAPQPLAPNPIAQTLDFRRAQRVDLDIRDDAAGNVTFAGRADMEPAPAPAFRVRRGTVVMAALKNDTDRFQAVHWHGHVARLLDSLDDGWKPFFIDTAICAPRTTTRIAFLADTPGRWLVTCQPINATPGPRVVWFEVG